MAYSGQVIESKVTKCRQAKRAIAEFITYVSVY